MLLTGLTAGMMILIFCFSMEPAEQSDKTSGHLTCAVIALVYPEFEQYPAEQQRVLYDQIQYAVRKTAHFMEYAALGLLIRLCLESWFGRRKGLVPISWLCGTAYAGTDEIHQIMIDGRSGMMEDVLLDSCGVITGAMIAAGVLALIHRRIKRRNSEG